MRYQRLGKTGLQVSALMLGGNVFGWNVDQAQSKAILDTFVAGGGNFIDTADVYARWIEGSSGGESEIVIGNWLKDRGQREAVLIATKVGSSMGERPNEAGLARHHIIAGCEASLRRLQTDYIDLYQAHIDDRETPLEETLAAFDHLVRSGKVRYIGASNISAWRLARALGISEMRGLVSFACVQPLYNLIRRDEFERDLQPLCLELGIGAITYGTLGGGFLSGKYRRDGAMPPSVRAANVQRRYMTDRNFAILATLIQVAEGRGTSPAQVALAWAMAQPAITAPIASATSAEQTRELLAAVDLVLDAGELRVLDEASTWR